MHNTFTSAISSAAGWAPGIEPMPPTTTTTKAAPMVFRSRSSVAGSRGSCSAPPRPASNAPSANTAVNSRAWRTPRAPSIPPSPPAPPTTPRPPRPDDDQQQIVRRDPPPQDIARARQARRARAEQFLGPPEPQHRVLDDQHQRKRGQQLEQFRRAVDAAQQQDFHQRPERPRRQRRQQQRGPKTQALAQQGGQRIGHEDAQHEERAMRKVHDARDPEDQRQPGAHQEQRGGPRQSVEQLNDETGKIHCPSLARMALRSSLRGGLYLQSGPAR